MNVDIDIPVNNEAEMVTLGSAISSMQGFTRARAFCTAEDFYRPGHEQLWRVAEQMFDNGEVLDPMGVMQELMRQGLLEKIGGSAYLATLIEHVAVTPETYALRVHEASRARRILAVHQRQAQILAGNVHDQDALLDGIARTTIELEMLVDERAADQPLSGLMSWPELWNIYPSETVDWLIPDLMVAEDVWMLLGGEGGGKSWFSRQFCLALAAGIHPFHPHRRIRPLRTLLVDLENAPAMVAYESRIIGSQVARLGEFNEELAAVWMKEDGLNLRDRSHALLLERAVAETNPDVVAIGSLYKAFKKGRDDWETAAEETREVFDRIRRRHHCAFLIEHHMPKARAGEQRDQTPYGSRVWMGWPSIGHTLHRVGENMYGLTEFRGTRLKREMPLGLVRGGELPWSPVWDTEELEFGMYEELKPKPRGGRR